MIIYYNYEVYVTVRNMFNPWREWGYILKIEIKKVGVLSLYVGLLETLDFTFHIGSTPTFFYFDFYLNTAYAARYVYFYTLKRALHRHADGKYCKINK